MQGKVLESLTLRTAGTLSLLLKFWGKKDFPRVLYKWQKVKPLVTKNYLSSSSLKKLKCKIKYRNNRKQNHINMIQKKSKFHTYRIFRAL